MAEITRSYQSRIVCDKNTREKLWFTHYVFNKRVDEIILVIFKMLRQDPSLSDDPEVRRVWQIAACYLLEPKMKNKKYMRNQICGRSKSPGTLRETSTIIIKNDGNWSSQKVLAKDINVNGKNWVSLLLKIGQNTNPLQQAGIEDPSNDLPGSISCKIFEDACATVNLFLRLKTNWRKEFEKYLEIKNEWEEDNEIYMKNARRHMLEFENQEGRGKAGRKIRAHKWRDFFIENPHLAAWNGGQPEVYQITEKDEEEIRKKPQKEQQSEKLSRFYDRNPELQELIDLHSKYQKLFMGRGPRGFRHPPTFTRPNSKKHPHRLSFNAKQTRPVGYENLYLPKKGNIGYATFHILTGRTENGSLVYNKEGELENEKLNLTINLDPRLTSLKKDNNATKIPKKGKNTNKYTIDTPYGTLGARVSGAKLVFGGAVSGRKDLYPYIYFSINIEKPSWSEKAQKENLVLIEGKKKIPEDIKIGAVDVGMRYEFLTIHKYNNNRLSIKKAIPIKANINHANIFAKEKSLRKKQGKATRGQKNNKRFRKHISDSKEDLNRKMAHNIVKTCYDYSVDVIVLENLTSLKTSSFKKNYQNNLIRRFSPKKLFEYIKEQAELAGILVWCINPKGTSQTCCKCGSLGTRYAVKKNNGNTYVNCNNRGSRFHCGNCDFNANADYNASVNVARKFIWGEKAIQEYQEYNEADKYKYKYKKLLEQIREENRSKILEKATGQEVETEENHS